MCEFDGSVAALTGAAWGIGRATAIALAAEGADVVLADIDAEAGEIAAREVEARGGRAMFVHTDVGSRGDVEELVNAAISWQGHCDLFMSNAAIGSQGAPHEFSPDDWEAVLAVDLHASIWATRAVLPHMLDRNRGAVAFVSSHWGYQGNPMLAPYVVAKFGLVGLAESVAAYLKGTGVSVSLVVPGAVASEAKPVSRTRYAAADRMSPEDVARVEEEGRQERVGWPTPESMATTIVEGLRARRFHIFQQGTGQYQDVTIRAMQRKWVDPEAFVVGEAATAS